MPYNVKIQNDKGEPLAGVVYFYDAQGTEIGQVVIQPGGSDMPAQAVENGSHFWVTSPGYSSYGTSAIYQDGNLFTLVRSVPNFVYYGLGAVGIVVLLKLFKVRL